MKIPKEIKRLCKTCKKHTQHKIAQAKNRGKNATNTMTRGSKSRLQSRGLWRGAGNHGSYSRPPIKNRKMCGKKRSKKSDLRYTCAECRKTSVQSSGFRATKMLFE